jgi:uncharacterized membrane protein YsdA (DUF1294 family)/cold shock CspA family protein
MRHAGRLSDWNDDKGYGFVVPNGGGDRAFVHVSAFERAGRRPANGDLLSYEAQRDAKGRTNAMRVRFAGQTAAATAKASNGGGFRMPHKPLAVASLVGLAAIGWWGKLPILAGYYGLMSIVSFALYRGDKHSARSGEWRAPENVLHAADVVGGWPGGLVAQGFLRHKSSKASFQVTFWFTVAVNCAIVYYILKGLK